MRSADELDADEPALPWEREGPAARIETPEQVELVFPLAPFGTRLLAALLDYAILALVNVAILAIAALLVLTGSELEESLAFVIAAFTVVSFLANTLYFAAFELYGQGQTPGKKTARIRAIMDTGHGLTAAAAVLRNLARAVDAIPLFWIVPALDKAGRRLGDLIAQTLVVRLAREKWPAAAVVAAGSSYAALARKEFVFTADQHALLTVDDMNLLEYFFTEAARHAVERHRLAAARKIADRYRHRLGLDGAGEKIDAQPLRFLEELYLFLCDRYARRGF
jgi:uncharacterized RDD family membrane protein YckC